MISIRCSTRIWSKTLNGICESFSSSNPQSRILSALTNDGGSGTNSSTGMVSAGDQDEKMSNTCFLRPTFMLASRDFPGKYHCTRHSSSSSSSSSSMSRASPKTNGRSALPASQFFHNYIITSNAIRTHSLGFFRCPRNNPHQGRHWHPRNISSCRK